MSGIEPGPVPFNSVIKLVEWTVVSGQQERTFYGRELECLYPGAICLHEKMIFTVENLPLIILFNFLIFNHREAEYLSLGREDVQEEPGIKRFRPAATSDLEIEEIKGRRD